MTERQSVLNEKIARVVFETMASHGDIDGDEADWIHYREMLEEAAAEIIAKFGIAPGEQGDKDR